MPEEDVQIVGERKNPSIKIRIDKRKIADTSEPAKKTGFQIVDQARIGEALIAQKSFDYVDDNTSTLCLVVDISY
jgi:hypothetical protein